jgi:hypothetical protein
MEKSPDLSSNLNSTHRQPLAITTGSMVAAWMNEEQLAYAHGLYPEFIKLQGEMEEPKKKANGKPKGKSKSRKIGPFFQDLYAEWHKRWPVAPDEEDMAEARQNLELAQDIVMRKRNKVSTCELTSKIT